MHISGKPYEFIVFVLLGMAMLVLWLEGALAMESQFKLELRNSYADRHNYLDGTSGEFDRDIDEYLFSVTPSLMMFFEKDVWAYIRGDFEWEFDSDGEQTYSNLEDDQKDIITNAYFSVGGKPLQAIVGRQPVVFGNGLISIDDAPAISLSVEQSPWKWHLQAGQIMDHSPLAGMTLAYEPGLFEQINLFGAWFQDRDDAFAHTLPNRFQLLEPTSDGELWWMGASAEVFLGDMQLRLNAIYEGGQVDFEHLAGETSRDIAAYLVDATLETNLNDRLSLAIFFFAASGDDSFRGDTLSTFISPLPHNSHLLIFFDPEWQDRNSEDILTYGGSTFYGVKAPGVQLTLAPVNDLLVESKVAILYPFEAPDDDRDQYGWEFDILFQYTFMQRYEFNLAAAHFEFGNFFENQDDQTPEAASLFSLGLTCNFF